MKPPLKDRAKHKVLSSPETVVMAAEKLIRGQEKKQWYMIEPGGFIRSLLGEAGLELWRRPVSSCLTPPVFRETGMSEESL